MATGHQSEAQERNYAGAVGTTRKKSIHYACPCGALVTTEVYVSVDASSDSELAQRLLAEDLALNTVHCPGRDESYEVELPVVYHAPANHLFVLVLPPALRYRELEERRALLDALAEESGADLPDYVRRFAVVYGSPGLNRYLEEQAEQALQGSRSLELTQRLEQAEQEVEKQREAMAAQQAEFEHIASELDRSSVELAERLQALDDREAALDRRSNELAERTRILADAEDRFNDGRLVDSGLLGAERPSTKTDPFERVGSAELEVGTAQPVARVVDSDEESTGVEAVIEETTDAEAQAAEAPVEATKVEPAKSDATKVEPAKGEAAAEGATRVGGTTDVAIERWIVSREPNLKVVDETGKVRLAASASAEIIEGLLTNRLALKLQMHALPAYPLVSLVIGTPELLRGDGSGKEPFAFHFDIGVETDRAVLDALQRRFTFSLEIYDNEYLLVRRRTIAAELEDNVGYVLAAAEEHLSTLTSPSFLKAVIGFEAPDYDRFGWKHPAAAEFRERLLGKLETAQDVRRALAIARRFSDPEQEGYLVLVRGYSLRAWHAQRLRVVERAVECGLWMGTTLARIAVSEGIARSRKDLLKKLQSRFVHLVADQHDLDEETIQDNWSALERESSSLGMTPMPVIDPGNVVSPQSGEISPVPPDTDSGAGAPIISGTIAEEAGAESPSGRIRIPVTERSVEELIGLLEDKDLRLDAAVELARQGEERAIGPVFNTLRRMTRGEAVRVLGTTPGFGDKATAHLIDGLRSRKGFLRQGCALALSVVKREEGIEAVCDLLIAEPTEIWREVARALGEVGPVAIMPLASRLASSSSQGEAPEELRERISWALAHIVGNGGSQPVTTLAGGRDPIAAQVAARALELAEHALTETQQLRGTATPREQTVNRAFSRRFFQALEGSQIGGASDHAHEGADLSGPAMLLDESDLIDLDDAEPLDESDLIPT